MLEPPLYLIRHGVTDWNLANRYQGTVDVPLNAQGREQARRSGLMMRRLSQAGVLMPDQATIVASPLSRARQSAELAVESLGIDASQISVMPQMRELAMGRWEGVNNLDVKERFYLERKSRKRDRWAFAPQGGESMADREKEVRDGLLSLAPQSVVFTHAGIIRMAFHILLGMDRQEAAAQHIDHAAVYLFDGVGLEKVTTEL